jgi:hypothetical protein
VASSRGRQSAVVINFIPIPLDLRPFPAYSPIVLLFEGRLPETCRRRSRMWRPRAGLVTPRSGGLGSPSAPTTRGCLQWLDVVGMKEGESPPDADSLSDRKERGDAFARCLGRSRRSPRKPIARLPRFPALRSPRLWGALLRDCGVPGAGQRIRATALARFPRARLFDN